MTESQPDPFATITAFPVLTTARLMLRQISLDDLGWYIDHFSRQEVAEGQGCAPPANAEAARADFDRRIIAPFEERDGLRWGLCLRPEGDDKRVDSLPLIGSAGVFYVDAKVRSCELGYDLDPDYWGRGYMSEAVTAILDFVFRCMGINRVQALLIPRNDRSRELVERLGFVEEGFMREHSVDERGELIDDILYALLRREWRGGS